MALTGVKYDGDNLEFSWNATAIEQEILREVVISRRRATYDKTGAGEAARRKHPGKYEYQLRVTLWGTTRDADTLATFDETAAAAVAFIVYPNGNTTSEIQRSGNAIITSIEETIMHDGMNAIVIQCDVDGAVTDGSVA